MLLPGAGLVDWHAHMLSPDLVPPPGAEGAWPGIARVDGATELTLGGRPYRRVDARTFSAGPRLAEMVELGVAMQVLSPPPYAVAFDGPPAEYASLATQQNAFLAGVVAASPGRFAMLAMLPYGPEMEAELDRLAAYPNVLGVCLTSTRDDHLCDEEHRAVWHRLSERGDVVFVHPADTALSDCDLSSGSVFGGGMPLATARLATRLITSGTLSAVPDLTVLLAHAGGAFPAMLERLDRGWRMGQLSHLEQPPSAYARRAFWADALAYGPASLGAATAIFGDDRLVYGSDYPFDALLTPSELDAFDPQGRILERLTANGLALVAGLESRRGMSG